MEALDSVMRWKGWEGEKVRIPKGEEGGHTQTHTHTYRPEIVIDVKCLYTVCIYVGLVTSNKY